MQLQAVVGSLNRFIFRLATKATTMRPINAALGVRGKLQNRQLNAPFTPARKTLFLWIGASTTKFGSGRKLGVDR
jgi:hypothetical protein